MSYVVLRRKSELAQAAQIPRDSSTDRDGFYRNGANEEARNGWPRRGAKPHRPVEPEIRNPKCEMRNKSEQGKAEKSGKAKPCRAKSSEESGRMRWGGIPA